MSTFKLVVKGELLPGQELEQVKGRIAQLFKLQDKPDQLAALFSPRPVTVKKGLSEAQAQAYYNVIENAGLGCELVAEGAAMPVEPPPQAPLAREAQAQASEAKGGEYVSSTRVAAEPPMANFKAPQQVAVTPPVGSAGDFDPYQQPQADLFVAPQQSELTLMEPRKLRMGAGWSWFVEGFGYFKLQPLMWLGTVAVYMVMMFVLGMIPVVNFIANILLLPVITGGFMVMCYRLYQGEVVGVGDMFACFKTHLGSLLLVGILYFIGVLAAIVIGIGFIYVFGLIGMVGVVVPLLFGGPETAPMVGLGAVLGFMAMMGVFIGLFVALVMAYWFAPALVVSHNLPALRAMWLSFKGCLSNILPFLIYGLVGMGLAIVATLPIMLGWLVLMPVMWGSMFAGYRQIFTDLANEQA